jgi:peptidoglycan hydrolase-like protein with peptidoglycan-binding domain
MNIVGRKFTHAEFQVYLESLNVTPWAKFVVVHNTDVPDIALYKKWGAREGKYKNWTPEQWLRNLASYYSGMGWKGGPHLFIPPTQNTILVLNSLLLEGTHSPSWNKFSLGVETVGNFEREAFIDPTKANLVAALAMLHKKFGLQPDGFVLGGNSIAKAGKGLHFHKEDTATSHKTCPGRNINKEQLVADVLAAMNPAPVSAPAINPPHTHEIPIASQEVDTSRLNSVEMTSIYWLQAALNMWSPSLRLVVNGVRDTKTVTAIKLFQTSQGLVPDEVGGPVTRVALKKATAA